MSAAPKPEDGYKKLRNGHIKDLFRRYVGNPILTVAHWPYPANSVFNSAAVRVDDGSTLLLVRVEDRRGISHFATARSVNGASDWYISPAPVLTPDESEGSDEYWGIEDPRAVFLPELGQYGVTYTGFCATGPHVKLSLTKDFQTFESYGSVMPPEDKDAALFPRRFNGRWAMIHRPVSPFSGSADIWLSFSPDLVYWGEHQVMLTARSGSWWDATKIGLSPPPLETSEGWLIMYHGVRRHASGSLYRLGVALFDLDDPSKLIRRGNEWVFGPEEPYERTGDVNDVVFPCGCTVDDDGDTLRMYYGAADTTMGLAYASIREILDWLKTQ